MSGSVHVREARATDRESLEEFHRLLYIDHRDRVVDSGDLPLIDYHEYEQVLTEDLATLMSDRGAVVLVAELEDRVVGYITGRIRDEARRVLPRRGIVEDWYVDESSRGKGVGRALLTELEERFARRGCDVIESATWAGNAQARTAHEALGFREIRVMYRKLVR